MYGKMLLLDKEEEEEEEERSKCELHMYSGNLNI